MKRMSWVGIWGVIALAVMQAATTLTGSLVSGGAWAAGPLKVVATTGMIADIVRQVGAERVKVRQLMGEGVDPHLYKTTRSDVAAMLRSDITFYNGLLLEGKMTDALIRVATSGRPVYAVTELIDEANLLPAGGQAGHYDPHVWMDPRGWAKAVKVVRDKLARRDPDGRASYAANAERLIAELNKLDAYASNALSMIPKPTRILVTAHDAFGYFGRRYDFDVLGIQGLSTESEAGLKRVEELVALLVERKIPSVFIESTIADRSVKALIAGAKARGHAVTIGGELFSDAMGPPGSYEGTYIGMIDHNVTVIARALGAEVPSRGLNGRLTLAQN